MKTTSTIAAAAASALVAMLPGTAHAAFGDGFSIAPVTANGSDAPAFPHQKPDQRAWWAGVCDLHAGGFAVGGDPGVDFPHCIEQPESAHVDNPATPAVDLYSNQLQPPLAPGVVPGATGPDGWYRQRSGPTPGQGPSWRVEDFGQAGGHPDGSASFWFGRASSYFDFAQGNAAGGPEGMPRDVLVSIPPGVIGNPNAVPKCPSEALVEVPSQCPPKSQVGVSTIALAGYTAAFPVYNVEPREGKTAELLISGAGLSTTYVTNVPIVAEARTGSDFGVDAGAIEIPSTLPLHAQTVTLWGVPWAASHDRYRPTAGYCHPITQSDPFGTNAWATPGMPVRGLPGGSAAGCSQNPVPYDPSWGPIRPFLSTQTDCSRPGGELDTTIVATNYNTPTVAREQSRSPQLENCGVLRFDASLAVAPTSSAADSATGLSVELEIPQNNTPPAGLRFNPDDETGAPAFWKSAAGLATSHLDETVVELPEGVSVNPSGAAGLEGCSEAQIGLTQAGSPPQFNKADPFDGNASDGAECPQGSVIGTAEVKTPLLDETLTGEFVLGQPKPEDIRGPDEALSVRLYLVVRNRERGLVAKIFGTTVTDPRTGKLTAVFSRNPRVPFDVLNLQVKGGDRGMLALQQGCSSRGWSADLKPWSGNAPAESGGAFTTSSNCGFGFSPTLAAGMSNPQGGGTGSFSFTFTREDGEQWFRGLTAKLPAGLLAKVREVPLCGTAQGNAGTCPAGSRIGTVDAAAGSGTPYVIERKGDVYLTEGYKGGEYGLSVVVPVEAGPFRGDVALRTIVVRQAIHVDRTTTAVTAISDPLPQIWHGIPIRMRRATVKVDRPGFMRSPTSCAPKQVVADFLSTEGGLATVSQPFQASNCGSLSFKPRLAMRMTGRKQTTTGKHPGLRAVVRQAVGQAGIAGAEVRLPKSLALDPDNAQALCEFDQGTKPDLEKHCPTGSIVGRARAVSPLLKRPLAGNVYFVKNVRRSSTGNLIRTLPMIIVALRGEVAVNLRGTSNTTRDGRLVNTFANVPDAPVSRFNLNVKGGRNGILAVTRTRRSRINVCRGVHIAEVDMDGQNGRRHDFDEWVETPRCRKAKRAKAGCRTAKQRSGAVCRRRTAAKRG